MHEYQTGKIIEGRCPKCHAPCKIDETKLTASVSYKKLVHLDFRKSLLVAYSDLNTKVAVSPNS